MFCVGKAKVCGAHGVSGLAVYFAWSILGDDRAEGVECLLGWAWDVSDLEDGKFYDSLHCMLACSVRVPVMCDVLVFTPMCSENTRGG